MTARVVVQRLVSLLVIGAMMAWLAWLVSTARSKQDYVVTKAQMQTPLAACTWTAMSASAVTTLGLDFEPTHAWSERKQVFIAFRTQPLVAPAFVQLRLAAVVGTGIEVDADGGSPVRVSHADELRLPLLQHGGVHVVTIHVGRALPPHGQDRRWLGMAISAIRVCGTTGAVSASQAG